MTWLILSLLTAVTVATQYAWVKKFFSHLSPYEMASFPMLFSQPFIIVSLFFVPVPLLDKTFCWYFLVSIPLNGISIILYMKALKVSPLSLTIPYLAFTPVFIIFTGYVFLDESPNIWGVVGIITTCIGCYILNIEPGKWSFLLPLKAIFKETGSWIMLIVSFLYSFCAVFGKVAILHSSPLFFSFYFFVVLNFIMLVLFFVTGKIQMRTIKQNALNGLIAGCIYFLHIIFHAFAISLTKAAYMVSVKRLNVLVSIIYGGVFFNEKNLKIRFLGALLMLGGTLLIMLLGK